VRSLKNIPIENPKMGGCGTCGTIPQTVLNNDKRFYCYGYIHCLTLTIDDIVYDLNEKFGVLDDEGCEEGITIDDIQKTFAMELSVCDYAELFHNTPLHDETWELNLEDDKWYLVKQGRGYA